MTSSTDYYVVGESHGHHDGAIAILGGANSDRPYVYYAQHTERFTGIKQDPDRYPMHVHVDPPGHVLANAFYERPLRANMRRLLTGETFQWIPKYDFYVPHHWSHAAAGYYTHPWGSDIEPVCVVIDAIGEFDSASIWYKKKKVWSEKYPKSVGLFYSATTKHIGFQPNRDEHLTMALAATGQINTQLADLFEWAIENKNLHTGFDLSIDAHNLTNEDIAATAQLVLEREVLKIMNKARKYSAHLVYGGGCALNCVANSLVTGLFEDTWIFPNPGDAGAALGAALAVTDQHMYFNHNYFGHVMDVDEPNPAHIAQHILDYGVCGIAYGGAEFGPRALGNRSLIGDPRSPLRGAEEAAPSRRIHRMKDRPLWSPLAPVILSEYFKDYFHGPESSYMSYVAQCMDTEEFGSIAHVDGSSRVQSIRPESPSLLRKVLEEWYEITGCPMLINTSLNAKGKPMINSWLGAHGVYQLEKDFGITIF